MQTYMQLWVLSPAEQDKRGQDQEDLRKEDRGSEQDCNVVAEW